MVIDIMNRTLLKDSFRLIKKTFGRFFLLTSIVALGVSFFVGIKASAPIMSYNVNKYNEEYKLMDFTIYSSYGFDDNDIEELSKLDYVSYVEDSNFVDVLSSIDSLKLVFRVHAITDDINNFKLIDGRLPKNEKECVIERSVFYFKDLKIGDKIKLERPDDDLDDFLVNDYFEVVGFVLSPYYINQDIGFSTLNNRNLNSFLYVTKDTFNMDYYTEVSLTFKNDIEDSFGSEYKDVSKELKEKLEKFGEVQVLNRKDKVLDEAYEEYYDGLEEYEDGLETFNTEIADAQKEIDDAKKEIKDGEKEIKDGYKELVDKEIEVEAELIKGAREIEDNRNALGVAHAQYMQAKEEFAVKKVELEGMISQIDGGISQIDGGLSQALAGVTQAQQSVTLLQQSITGIEVQIAALDPNDPNYATDYANLSGQLAFLNNNLAPAQAGLAQAEAIVASLQAQKNDLLSKKAQIQSGIAEGQKKLDDAGTMIDSGFRELTNASVKLDEARVEAEEEFRKARQDLKDAEIEIADAKIELADAIKEFEEEKIDGQQELDEAKADLEKAKQDIEDLEDGEWTVLSREEHYSSKTYSDTISQMTAIGNVFPVFFFLVASLVCLTTMTRMIDEQRGQIGIYRALGYRELEIYYKYINYALLATLIGGVIGSISGLLLFPRVIYNAWNMMYNLPKYQTLIPWDLIFIANISFIIVMLLTTYLTCRSEIKEVPSQLLRPKVPVAGKSILIDRIGFIWNNINFSTKLTIRNIVRYKKRFFMTVIGVAGCSALIITGLGIRDSIGTIVEKQFNEIYKFDGSIMFEEDTTISEGIVIYNEILEHNETNDALLVTTYDGKVFYNNREEVIKVTITDDIEKINDFYVFRNRKDLSPIELKEEGIIINEKLGELLNININDVIKMESENGLIKQVKVIGLTENYVNNELFMSSTYYKEVFNTSLANNTVIIKANNPEDTQIFQDELLDIKGVDSISFNSFAIETFNGMVSGLNSIMIVIILAAASLAFVVLSNLTNVNISERERELATFKVLGFTQKEINMFIYKENLVLTFVGAIAGIPLGKILHKYIIYLVEMDSVMFSREINNTSLIFAVVLTLVFSLFVNVFMARKLKNINMVEALKSVE